MSVALTILRNVEWRTSKTGQINPVAVFDPVDLGGAIISRATLHNVSFIESLHLGIGDRVSVYRRNMATPQVDKNLTKSGSLSIPQQCPSCGKPARISNENGSKFLWCDNPDCPAQIIRKFKHFCSRDAMNIAGLSGRTLEKVMDAVPMTRFIEIYNLSKKRDQLLAIDGLGEKSVDSILQEIQESRKVRLENFINALSIPMIGYGTAKAISEYFRGSWRSFREAVKAEFDFSQIRNIGSELNDSIYVWIGSHYGEMELLSDEMKFQVIGQQGIKFKLLTFVIAGNLHCFDSRDACKEAIRNLGGKVASSVSSKTSYLINNDKNSLSFKNRRAKELGIPIISEEELINMMTR